ncbi:helix-turn-helix transcriptional regulator [Leuconostoc citreum]
MASRLKELRKERNKTLVDIEKATGIKRSTYSDYENGIVKTGKLEIWEKLADYFNVSVSELMGIDDIHKQISDWADIFRKSNDRMLSYQLDRINKTKLHEMESSTLAVAIEMVMDLYEKYKFNDDKTTDVSSILRALNFMINNAIDDDDDYQNTIDTFTKLVNNLKAQNKKATDD